MAVASGQFQPESRRATWMGYVVSISAVVVLTVALVALYPVFPLGRYPIAYIVLIMAVAYLFGEGPAILTFVSCFLAFEYTFMEPPRSIWPHVHTADGWAQFLAFFLGTLIVGFATVLMRRSRHRMERYAAELAEARRVAEHGRSELETILSSMMGGVIVVDADRKVVYANPAIGRLLRVRGEIGDPLETWVRGANVRELDGTHIEMAELPLVKALQGETIPEKLLLMDGESGPDTVMSSSAAPIREPGGEITGGVVIIRNVTPQRRLQEDLERQRTLLETFTQNVPVGLAFLNHDLRYVIANQALSEIGGIPAEKAVGKSPREFLRADVAADIEAAARKVIEADEPVQWRDYAAVLDGERFFDVDYLPVRTSQGEMIGIGLVVVETTERVRARHELERVYEHEHRIAETLQTGLLGTIPARMNGFEFETVYRAALEEARVGGDFYDVFQISDDKIGVVVGDVSGKGLKAAVEVAMAKYSLRGRAYECDKPSAVMGRVNETLVRDMDIEGFVTIFGGILDCRARTLTYANAGHSPAILWKAAEDRAVLLGPTGPLLGMQGGLAYDEQAVGLQRGDELLLGTDGLFEVLCDREFLEVEGLLEIYTELKRSGVTSAAALVDRVVDLCKGGLRDDIAILRVSVVE